MQSAKKRDEEALLYCEADLLSAQGPGQLEVMACSRIDKTQLTYFIKSLNLTGP